jgi:hypothetical protein
VESANEHNRPLINEPVREAVASLRGYWAQVWRSVLVWMQLADTERLYLEGAEDMDRVSGLDAEAIQVKDTAGNITLRSPDVIETIGNAYMHQQRNPQHAVTLRFLTTAGIGTEQGTPFGGGIGGLRLWNSLRTSTDEPARNEGVRAIAKFLLAEGKIPVPVRAFLGEASDEQIWRRLIVPIDWDTDAVEVPDVIQEIRNRLVVLGETYGVPPDHAAAVAEHLYAFAYAIAIRQKERQLTRADLLRLFQDRTHESVPAGVLQALLAAIPADRLPAGAMPVAIGGRTGPIGRVPPVPTRFYRREALDRLISERLAAYPIVVLQGGTGVGKSVAAIGHLVSSQLSWGWVHLRGVKEGAVADLLNRITAQLESEEGLADIVLDDIELPDDARSLEVPFGRIGVLLQARGGSLIITSAAPLPNRLALALGLPASATMAIPAFSRDEIREFLILRGCPEVEIAGWWAAFIEVHTSGHAQLVHARVATLEGQGFPVPEMSGLIATPTDVVEARTEARHLVAALDAPARELAYRLSLSVQSFPQQQVFTIAALSPPIGDPGLAFDSLVGPWVEAVGEGYHRISPLLLGVGAAVRGQAWTEAMHRRTGRASSPSKPCRRMMSQRSCSTP